MYSMKEKMCGDTNAVVGKIPRGRKKSKHMLRPSGQFLEGNFFYFILFLFYFFDLLINMEKTPV